MNNNLISQSNDITTSRFSWTALMGRSYAVIANIFFSRYNEWKKAHPWQNLREANSYDGLLSYDIPRSSLAITGEDGQENLPKVDQLKFAFNRLQKTTFLNPSLKPGDWESIPIIGGVKYDSSTDTIHVDLYPMLVDRLVELREKFTLFNPAQAMLLNKSMYSFRFFLFCCQWRKERKFEYTIEKLKAMFKLDEHVDEDGRKHKEQYKRTRQFKEKVIDPARAELRELFKQGLIDICFDYTELKKANKQGKPTVIGYKFKIICANDESTIVQPNAKKKPLLDCQKEQFNMRMHNLCRIRLHKIFEGGHDAEWANRIIIPLTRKAIEDTTVLDKAEAIVDSIEARYKLGKVRNLAGTIRSAYKRDLGINVDLRKKQSEELDLFGNQI